MACDVVALARVMARHQNAINNAIEVSLCHHMALDAVGGEPRKTQQKTPLSRGSWIFRDNPEQWIGAQKRIGLFGNYKSQKQ